MLLTENKLKPTGACAVEYNGHSACNVWTTFCMTWSKNVIRQQHALGKEENLFRDYSKRERAKKAVKSKDQFSERCVTTKQEQTINYSCLFLGLICCQGNTKSQDVVQERHTTGRNKFVVMTKLLLIRTRNTA